MDANEFRRAGHQAIEEVAAYYEKLQLGSKGFQVAPSIRPGEIYAQIPASPPTDGENFEEIQKAWNELVLPGTCHWQHPSFFAYFAANSTFESIIADIYTGAASTPGFNHSCNPVSTELEQAMTGWVGQLLGLDAGSFSKNGVIQGTASESALIATIAARERAIRLLLAKGEYASREEVLPKMVMYGSTQTHSLGAKAGLVLGIHFRALETTAPDSWALRGDTFEQAIKEDKAKGLIPFMLIATVGSTSSGTTDYISELCSVAKQHQEIYIHVDAAWAGVYLALPEQRQDLALAAINQRGETIPNSYTAVSDEAAAASGGKERQLDTYGEVHSFCTNLHKSGLVTFDCSTFFIRDSALLTEVLDVTPPFLRNQTGYGAVTDYRNWGLTLGRRFRSLKILFMLRSFGVSGFQMHLRRTIALTERLEELVERDDDFELVTRRSLALLVFRLRPSALRGDAKAVEGLNKRLYANLHKRTSIQLTSTVIGGTFCIRFAVGSPGTREEHILEAWSSVRQAADEELSVASASGADESAATTNGQA